MDLGAHILKIHPLFFQEIRRLNLHVRDLVFIQALNLTTFGIFSFFLQETLSLHPDVGGCLFWLTQGSTLFWISDRLFQKDLQQGLLDNVLNSSLSLTAFIGIRWLIFTFVFSGSIALCTPLFLTILSLKSNLWFYFICLIFPFSGLVLAYSGLLSLLTQGLKSYLLPLLLFPFMVPLFIWVISGSLGNTFEFSLKLLFALMFCILPLVAALIIFILYDIEEHR